MKIFGDHAPAYYAAGLPVIPLRERNKMPVIQGWSKFHDQLPPEDIRDNWVERLPNCNMGLVLGEQSGVVMIDIDTNDEGIIKTITDTLGVPSPWERIGAKGKVLAFKYAGVPTFRIKTKSDETLVEHLSSRTQVVLPPSIHPDTQKPYVANVDLLEVINNLPTLPDDIEERLRAALSLHIQVNDMDMEISEKGSTKVTEWTPVGARDVQMTKVGGLLANGVMRGEITLKEAFDRLEGWHLGCVEKQKLAGDDVDINKGKANIVKFVRKDVLDRGKVLPKGWDAELTDEMRSAFGVDLAEDNEEHTFDQIKDDVHAAFEDHEATSSEAMTAVETALRRMAVSVNLTDFQKESIMNYINAVGKGVFKMGMLRKQLNEMVKGPISGTDHTEIAEQVIKDLTERTPLAMDNIRLMEWNGSHWQEADEHAIMQHIAKSYGDLPAAKKFSDHKGILSTIKSLLPNGIQKVQIDGVNFANGFLTKGLKLIDHHPDFGMTYTLPYRYLPDDASKCFRFMQLLDDAWREDADCEEKILALQEAICATIFGLGPAFQRAVLLYGVAHSGKSQILDIVQSLMPANARSAVPPTAWGDRFGPSQLVDSLFNAAGELAENKPIPGDMFKAIVDGTEISAEFKNKPLFVFTPKATHWFASNHLPTSRDTSAGFSRRWLVLMFNRAYRGQKVLNLGHNIIVEEREAIAAWAIQALERLIKNDAYTIPPSHLDAMYDVRVRNNNVEMFLSESSEVRFDETEKVSEDKVYAAYKSFCIASLGSTGRGLNRFRNEMRQLSVEYGFEIVAESLNGQKFHVYHGMKVK